MEEKEFKELVEEMKSFFGVSSLEKVAQALGYNKSVATTWRGRKAFSENAILKYKLLKSQSSHNPTQIKPMTGVEFREIREKLGMTQDALSKEIGINIRQISRIETGEADVRDYHEKLILTLLEKRSKKYKNDVKTQKITYYPNIKASAGYGTLNEDEESIEIDTNLIKAINLPQKNLDMIQVQGDSMHPYIENGDFALIERSSEAKNGDIIIANYKGDLYIKQLQKNPQNKSISLISSNKDYPSFEIKDDEAEFLQIIGILRGVIRVY